MIETLMGLLCWLPSMLFSLLFTLFTIWMLVDCLMNEPSEGVDKLVWVLVILFLPLLGAILYLIFRRPQRKRQYGR